MRALASAAVAASLSRSNVLGLPRSPRLRPALQRAQAAACARFQHRQKILRPDGTADALAFAQARRRRGVLVRVEEAGEALDARAGRRDAGQAVVLEAEQSARARPAPVLRAFDEPRPHRIERDMALGRDDMRLVHRDRPEPPLPEVAGAPPARMDAPGIGAMHARQGAAQPVLVARAEDIAGIRRHAQTPTRASRAAVASRSR